MCVGQEELATNKIFIRHSNARSDGEIVGLLLGVGEFVLRRPGTRGADVDFIALAVGRMPQSVACSLGIETLRKNSFYELQWLNVIRKTQPGVIVMAVRWTGSIAHRIALGWVTLQGWVDSKPEFRTVVLA